MIKRQYMVKYASNLIQHSNNISPLVFGKILEFGVDIECETDFVLFSMHYAPQRKISDQFWFFRGSK